MTEPLNFVTEQIGNEAMGWIFDLAYDEQDYYLSTGDFTLDYGDEWKEVATQRATWCQAIADAATINGELERWADLAQRYRESCEDSAEDASNE